VDPTKGEFFTCTGADICVNIGATSSHNRHLMVNTTMLAWQWGTSIETATTLTSTTVCAVQFYPANKCSCHFFTRQGQLHFPPLCTKWYL